MRVVVAGGGIIGCATAFELAKTGCTVTLLERSTPGAEASGAAAGLLTVFREASDSLFTRLAVASWRLYPAIVRELRERTGMDVEHATHGTLYPLHGVDAVARAQELAKQSGARDLGLEAWDADEVRKREPALGPSVRGALFVKADQWVNNQLLVTAYARAAAAAGVVVRAGAPVERVIVEGGRARGVVAAGERIDADVVLLAAGAWTGELVASFGEALPTEPVRGQMLALAHEPALLRHCIHGADVYLVPRPSGELLIGATVERAGFKREVTADGVASLLAAALALAPDLGALAITRTWHGFRPWVPDGLPVLGPWPGVAGLFVATAHYRNGILLAPITAQLMREWITAGRPSMDVGELLPDRFVRTARSTS